MGASRSRLWAFLRPLVVLGGGVLTGAGFFLLLPLIQAVSAHPPADMVLREADLARLPPPPPPTVQEQEPEEEPEEVEPPSFEESSQPLALSELEVALDPGLGAGWGAANVSVHLGGSPGSGGDDVDELFSLAELDQEPRVLFQPPPPVTGAVRAAGGGTVYVMFFVEEDGSVREAKVQKASSPALGPLARKAVLRWKFEPALRQGKPVRYPMRVPITFPKGS